MNPLGHDARSFRIDDPGDELRTLRGWIESPADAEERAQPLPYVLVLHGFKGFMDWGFFPELARRLVGQGLAVIRFNFSGSGVGEDPLELSEERAFFANTPSRQLDDVERVRTWLDGGAVPWIDPRRGGLFGHSMGGAIALLHAARRHDYRALVAWAPVAHFRRFAPEVEALWREQGQVEILNARTGQVHRLGLDWLLDIERNPRALDVEAACRRLATPTLIVHGSQDEAVPLEEGRRLAAAFPPGVARIAVQEGANHTFGAVHPLAGVPAGLERALQETCRAFANLS
jgi:dienelactone hydrolase